MVLDPTGSTEVVRKAVVPLIVEVPRDMAPLVKVMVPVTPEGTVAVMVTLLPKTLGPGDVRVMVGVALSTTCIKLVLAAPLLLSPL